MHIHEHKRFQLENYCDLFVLRFENCELINILSIFIKILYGIYGTYYIFFNSEEF